MTAESIWERVDLPILKLLAEADRRPLSGAELGAAAGFEAQVLMRSLQSLKEANLISGKRARRREAGQAASDG